MPRLVADFERSVSFWLLSTAKYMEHALNDELHAHGITYRQFQVLACLACHGELTQGEIAERLTVEPPTIVRVLDRMERDGWIARHDDPTDRRKKIIRPTENVQPVWEKFLACGVRVRHAASNGLTDAEIDNFLRTLKTIRSNLGAEEFVSS